MEPMTNMAAQALSTTSNNEVTMFYRKNLLFALALATFTFLAFPLFSSYINSSANATEVQSDNPSKEIVQAVTNHFVKPPAVNDPNSPNGLRVTKVIYSGKYALANWLQGEGGGQAALIKKNEQWTVVSAGGGAMNSQNLVEFGFPPDVAQKLIDTINQPSKK
jgi:hypothetical protein